MENRKLRTYLRLTAVFLALNLLLCAGILCFLAVEKRHDAQAQTKYLPYIGLNDRDTYQQEMSVDEARAIIDDICLQYTDAYTVFEAAGCWTDETDTPTREKTLVYMFYGISEENLTRIMDNVLVQLNQSTILVETQTCRYRYHYGE